MQKVCHVVGDVFQWRTKVVYAGGGTSEGEKELYGYVVFSAPNQDYWQFSGMGSVPNFDGAEGTGTPVDPNVLYSDERVAPRLRGSGSYVAQSSAWSEWADGWGPESYTLNASSSSASSEVTFKYVGPYDKYYIYKTITHQTVHRYNITQRRLKPGAGAVITAENPNDSNLHFVGWSFPTVDGINVDKEMSLYTKAVVGSKEFQEDVRYAPEQSNVGSLPKSTVNVLGTKLDNYGDIDESVVITTTTNSIMVLTANPSVEKTGTNYAGLDTLQLDIKAPRIVCALYAENASIGGVYMGPKEDTLPADVTPISSTPTAITPEESGGGGGGGGMGSYSSVGDTQEDRLDILHIPSNLATYDAAGVYIGDAPYAQLEGIVVSADGTYYDPVVRINSITNSLTGSDTMEMTQYAKFDTTAIFKEGSVVYGVLYGEVKFGGHIESVSYTLNGEDQLISYTCVGFRKNFENAPWVFNYKQEGIEVGGMLSTILGAAPLAYYRGRSGSLPSQSISEVNLSNNTIGDGLNYLFSSAGHYAWYLGPDKIFKIIDVSTMPVEVLTVPAEGAALSSAYKITDLNLNYSLTDKITRLIIRGDFKRDTNNNPLDDEDGNPTYLLYDTGWVGTAHSSFNVQKVKTIIDERFKYTEGIRDDSSEMAVYAHQWVTPFKDASIGGTCSLDGVLLDYSIGKAVRIEGSAMTYLNSQNLAIYDVKYNLDDKKTEMSLSNNYWFGTDMTNYFMFLEDKIKVLLREVENNKDRTGNHYVAMGKITQKLTVFGTRTIVLKDETAGGHGRRLSLSSGCRIYNANWSNLRRGAYIYVKYKIRAGRGIPVPGTTVIPTYSAYEISKVG